VLVLTGITETEKEKNVDSVILETRKELEMLRSEVDKYKIIFDSARLIVGHEFIKPLTSISGFTELLESELEDRIDDRESRYFNKIREAIARLDELVDSFVQMLRFESKAELYHDLVKVDLYQFMRKVAGNFGEDSNLIEIEVDNEVAEVALRRKSLEFVLDNLISNALKNNRKGLPIKIRALRFIERRGTSRAKQLKISVEDRGVGIPEDEINDIFNPFYRVGGKSEVPGMGLGLSIVKNIITILKGEIFVSSKPGKGTTITFTVPLSDGRALEADRVG
jgi:signal transduction histidine kinase